MFCFAYYTLYGEVEMKIKLDKETMIREFGGRGKWYESEVYLKLGNDMMMDPGIGTCGKAGQGVPVGVAQPSILIDKMTVGGTKL